MKRTRWSVGLLAWVWLTSNAYAVVSFIACPGGRPVIVFSSVERASACTDEVKAHGDAGPICQAGLVAAFDHGAKVRWISIGDTLAGSQFDKVEILDRPFAGVVGVVPHSCFHAEVPPESSKPTQKKAPPKKK